MATVSVPIASGADDGTRTDATLEVTATTLTINATSDAIYLRFNSVAIAQGSTISAATITLIGDSSTSTATVRFDPQLADNAGALSAGEDGSGRTWGTGGANSWAIPALTAGTSYTTPDIADVIQQVISRAGWASGNALVVRLQRTAPGSKGYFDKFRSGDHGSTPKYATLDVTYTAPSAGQPTAKRLGGIDRGGRSSGKEGVAVWCQRASGLWAPSRRVLVYG